MSRLWSHLSDGVLRCRVSKYCWELFENHWGSFLHFPELDIRIHKPAYEAGAFGETRAAMFPWSCSPLKEQAFLLIGVDLTNSHMGAGLLFWLP